MRKIALLLIVCFLSVLTVSIGKAQILNTSAHSTPSPAALKSYGHAQPLGNGTVRSYFVSSDSSAKTPVAIGVEFTAQAFDGLPDRGENTFFLTLPDAANESLFKFIQLNWNPHGHIPPGVYDLPHFDFHFYITGMERLADMRSGTCSAGGEGVDCETFRRGTITVPTKLVAPGHINVGAVVPAMGNHLIDVGGSEFRGTPFTHTFIYGSFDGEITFFEPMITRAFLLGKPSQCIDFKQPSSYEVDGWYPTQYCMRYEQSTNSYTVSLEGFRQHQDRAQLISQIYSQTFCRQADADTLKTWENSGLSIRKIMDTLPTTNEGARATLVRSLYLSLLGRDPGQGDCLGLRSWVDSNLSLEAVVWGIIHSDEYQHRMN